MSATNHRIAALSLDDASDLAQIAQAASIHFLHLEQGARKVLAAGAQGDWRAAHEAEMAEAVRLRAAADRLHRDALARERQALREQCIAVRVIQALAMRLQPAEMMEAAE